MHDQKILWEKERFVWLTHLNLLREVGPGIQAEQELWAKTAYLLALRHCLSAQGDTALNGLIPPTPVTDLNSTVQT